MAEAKREVWITGIGILSCLGEGPEAHWQGLNETRSRVDEKTFAPFPVHPLAPVNFDLQIPKKGDQRQMEPWQRIGTYAAGLALDSAKVKGDADLLARMDMIVAAGGGERDLAVDGAILSGLPKADKPGAFLNERLMNDLRPTLFLAQLSNLLAGNISIVHGVTGSSRTFMGEESAGFDAVRIALARIAAGQSDIAIVGGAHSGERKELLMLHEFGGYNLKGAYKPVWERAPQGGLVQGSLGAFLVLEDRAHAQKRGATPFAKLSAVVSDRSHRGDGDVSAMLDTLWDKLPLGSGGEMAVISGATGAETATAQERAVLERHKDLPVRATGTHIGHGFEPQFAMNIALAALAIHHGKLFPPCDGSGMEKPANGPLKSAVVTGVGHWRGEGLALIEAAG